MAYVPGQKLDDQQQQQQGAQAPGAPSAPVISSPAIGSTPAVGGTVVGQSAVAQPQKPAGTGFVNIDKYLNANQGAGEQVKTAADKALAGESTAFGAAQSKAQSGVDAQKSAIVDPSAALNNVLGATSADQRQAAVDAAKQALSATYQGPNSTGYDIGNTEQIKQAQALSNAQSAGKQLAALNGPTGQYGTGLSAIDRAIYGSAANAGTLADIGNKASSQVGAEQAAESNIKQQAADVSGQMQKRADDTRTAFQDKANQLKIDAQNALLNAQTGYQHAQANRPASMQTTGTFTPNTSASNYANMRDKTGVDPAAAAAERSRYRTGLTNEQQDRYDKAWDAGLTGAEARREATMYGGDKQTTTSYQWDPGSGMPTDRSAYADVNSLNAIGQVLGDQSLVGMQQAAKGSGGKWTPTTTTTTPPGSAPLPLPQEENPITAAPISASPNAGAQAINAVGQPSQTDIASEAAAIKSANPGMTAAQAAQKAAADLAIKKQIAQSQGKAHR